MLVQHLGEPHDGVQRRAQLVGYVGEEVCFQTLRLLQRGVFLDQRLFDRRGVGPAGLRLLHRAPRVSRLARRQHGVVDVDAVRVGDAPPGERTVRVQLCGAVEAADRLVEPELRLALLTEEHVPVRRFLLPSQAFVGLGQLELQIEVVEAALMSTAKQLDRLLEVVPR